MFAFCMIVYFLCLDSSDEKLSRMRCHDPQQLVFQYLKPSCFLCCLLTEGSHPNIDCAQLPLLNSINYCWSSSTLHMTGKTRRQQSEHMKRQLRTGGVGKEWFEAGRNDAKYRKREENKVKKIERETREEVNEAVRRDREANDKAHTERKRENQREGEQEEQLSFYTSINMRVDETIQLTGLVFGAFVGHVSTPGADQSEGKSPNAHVSDINLLTSHLSRLRLTQN